MENVPDEIKFDIEFFRKIFEENIPFNKLMGFKLMELKPGFAKICVPFRSELVGEIRENRMHGGVIMAAMDTVAGAASITTIHFIKDKIATIDLRADFLSPAKQEDLIVEGKVSKSGSRIVFVQMQAYHDSDTSQIIAEGRAAFSVKRFVNH